MVGKILGAEQAFLFACNPQKEDGTLRTSVRAMQRVGDVKQQRRSGAVVHGAVVNAIAIDGLANSEVVDVRGQNNIFVLELRIGARQPGDDVVGLYLRFNYLGLRLDA